MNTKPEALRLAEILDRPGYGWNSTPSECAAELRRLHALNAELLAVLKEFQESASYWSEYDVPLGIVDRINSAIAKAEAT